ncbi:hypothetical protein [Candidatus Sororendozoicomonas aggregata]|uniref:hypothetical protein n=1 Tax=Candidatus Sororendozoicomonas aggregata TaxID=3073239 RepID=UPI002ED19337
MSRWRQFKCWLLGCWYDRRDIQQQTRKVSQRRNRRHWIHQRFEHRVFCGRCGKPGRWIRHKHFPTWFAERGHDG